MLPLVSVRLHNIGHAALSLIRRRLYHFYGQPVHQTHPEVEGMRPLHACMHLARTLSPPHSC